MTATEALIWCLQHVRDEVIDGDIETWCVFDKDDNPHWVAWKYQGEDVYPRLCCESWNHPFAEAEEPYTTERKDAK